MKDIVKQIAQVDERQLNDIISAVMHRYDALHDDGILDSTPSQKIPKPVKRNWNISFTPSVTLTKRIKLVVTGLF